jgi:hypothetical protein
MSANGKVAVVIGGASGVETFNVSRGGEHFFLPSLSALGWLGEER